MTSSATTVTFAACLDVLRIRFILYTPIISVVFSSIENPTANGQGKRTDTCLTEISDLPNVWVTK